MHRLLFLWMKSTQLAQHVWMEDQEVCISFNSILLPTNLVIFISILTYTPSIFTALLQFVSYALHEIDLLTFCQ